MLFVKHIIFMIQKKNQQKNTHEFMGQFYQILIFLFLSYIPMPDPLIFHSLANLLMYEIIFSSKLF